MNAATSFHPLELQFKLRSDLQWSQYAHESPPTWVAHDPISMEYFYFSDFERKLLQQLDGKRNLADLLKHSAGGAITDRWLLEFIFKAEAARLVLRSALAPTGQKLWQAKQQKRSLDRFQWLLSPLAIRIKLFDPSRILQYLAPLANILFSRTIFVLFVTLAPIIGYLVLLDLLHNGKIGFFIQTFQQLNTQKVFSLLVIFVVLKSLHELGHALACKKWKSECHEVGVMFLVFAPCLYCNTSDSWKLSDRWRRAAIAAAGIYVEMLVATVAAVVWLITRADSWIHWAAGYAMAIGSISTVLVNANPLLRYDGYYILSDLWRVPNLSEQSREAVRAILSAWFSGKSIPFNRWDANPFGLAVFGVAAFFYRTALLVVILLVVWSLLDGFGLRLIAIALLALTISTALYGTLVGIRSFAREMQAHGGARRRRLFGGFVILLLGIGAIFGLSWPAFVSTRGTARPVQIKPIYAKQAGSLVNFATPGSPVEPGDELVQLHSFDLELELAEVDGRIALLEEQLNYLRLALVDDEQAALELGDVVEQISMQLARREILKSEIESLVATAADSGRFIASDYSLPSTLAEDDHQPTWQPLLSAIHLGAAVERGTLMGWLVKQDAFELRAFVSESDSERISPGMQVTCRWDFQPSKSYRGTVRRVAPEPIQATPDPLVGDSMFASTANAPGTAGSDSRHYEVLIDMDEFPPTLTHHCLATVHIRTASQTLWQRSYRYFMLNIRPELVR